MNPSTNPTTTCPSLAWVNINLRLIPFPNTQRYLTRQAAVAKAIQLSNFTTILHSLGYHIHDTTIE